ncbi:MAG: Dabb family protein [Bacteroidales bacterium]|nr:Dabb family protein [Bacteroidales bacterium]
MLKHIVFIRLNKSYSEFEKTEIVKEITLRLNKLPDSIDEIVSLETGTNFSTRPTAFDLSLSVSFENNDDLQRYQIHPKHKEVLSYLGSLKLETAVVDYFI